MKAVICREFAPVDALEIGAFAAPTVAPGALLIDVRAAGVNFPDGLMVQGKYQTKPPVPFVPGSELGGIVRAVGEGVSGFAVGDRIEVIHPSGNFELTLAHMENQERQPIECAPGNGHRVWIPLENPLPGAMLARFFSGVKGEK